jgi:hypothetical protein
MKVAVDSDAFICRDEQCPSGDHGGLLENHISKMRSRDSNVTADCIIVISQYLWSMTSCRLLTRHDCFSICWSYEHTTSSQ